VWATSALASCRSVDAEGFPCSAQGACPPGFACGKADNLCHGPKTQVSGNDAGCQGATCPSDGPPGDLVVGADTGDAAVAPIDARDGGAEAATDARDAGTVGSDATDGSVVCTADGAGLGCDLPNRCHVGRVVCTGTMSTCQDTGEVQSDGISCGTGMVCSGGECKACAADTFLPADRPALQAGNDQLLDGPAGLSGVRQRSRGFALRHQPGMCRGRLRRVRGGRGLRADQSVPRRGPHLRGRAPVHRQGHLGQGR
jgi:hypothetical protein